MSELTWTQYKFLWLRAFLQDRQHCGMARDVGIWVVMVHWRDDRGCRARVGINRIADELGASRRAVIRAVNALVETGWLVRERGGRWHGDVNYYYLPDTVPPHYDEKKGDAGDTHMGDTGDTHSDAGRVSSTVKKGVIHGQEGCHPRSFRVPPVTPESSRGSSGGPERVQTRAAGAAPLSGPRRINLRKRPITVKEPPPPPPRQERSGHRSRKERSDPRVDKTAFPAGWTCGNDEIDAAQEVCPHWDAPKVVEEFEALRNRACSDGWRSADWMATLRTWCRRGKEYEQSHPVRKEEGTVRDGIERWLREKVDGDRGMTPT